MDAPGDAPIHFRLLLRAAWLLQDEEEEGGTQCRAGDGGVSSWDRSGTSELLGDIGCPLSCRLYRDPCAAEVCGAESVGGLSMGLRAPSALMHSACSSAHFLSADICLARRELKHGSAQTGRHQPALQTLLGCCSHPATCTEPSAPQQLQSEEDSPPPCPRPSTALQTNPKRVSEIRSQPMSCMD